MALLLVVFWPQKRRTPSPHTFPFCWALRVFSMATKTKKRVRTELKTGATKAKVSKTNLNPKTTPETKSKAPKTSSDPVSFQAEVSSRLIKQTVPGSGAGNDLEFETCWERWSQGDKPEYAYFLYNTDSELLGTCLVNIPQAVEKKLWTKEQWRWAWEKEGRATTDDLDEEDGSWSMMETVGSWCEGNQLPVGVEVCVSTKGRWKDGPKPFLFFLHYQSL